MRFASWSWGGRPHVGTISGCGREATPLALADAERGALPLIEALARGEPLPAPAGARLPVEAIELRAPLPKPLRSIFCIGRNYRAHAAELADSVFRASLPAEDAWPIVFTKLADCVVGPHDAVRLPGAAVTTQIDYESELAVVIGRGGRDIARSRAMEHVFGYTIVNDVSARDIQLATSQWTLGKSFPTFTPLGPAITTADEISDPHALDISLTINGETLQSSNTNDLIFKIPALIAYISHLTPLEAGDIVSTGTPEGVGLGRTPKRWLKPNEEVIVTIEKLGQLRNPTVAE
jgi:2-keto-4-pentenoate hydratase/2-oxohepta-3-ene-1,7-dioic acid hydratase in catechol pathway